MNITDPVERDVAAFLDKAGVGYIHESDGAELDFYLPKYDIHIECKAFYTDRIVKQTKDKRNVIVVQGYKSAEFLKNLGAIQ